MSEKHSEQFIREVAGARDETVPKSEKPKREVIWSPEATAKGRKLAEEISRLYAQAKGLEEKGDMPGIRNTYAEINSLVSQLEALKEKEAFPVIRAKTPEGKEIIFDLKEIREHWAKFYQDHNIPEMAEALPETISLTKEQIARIERLAEQEGFNHFLLLPENPDQYLGKIKEETGDKPLEGLPDGEQYAEIYLWDEVKKSFPSKIQTKNRPEAKAYLLMVHGQRQPGSWRRNQRQISPNPQPRIKRKRSPRPHLNRISSFPKRFYGQKQNPPQRSLPGPGFWIQSFLWARFCARTGLPNIVGSGCFPILPAVTVAFCVAAPRLFLNFEEL